MQLPTCPPWEAVSHFCCFIPVLPLLGQREQEEVCSRCILPPPVPWTHHQPGTNPSKRPINQPERNTIKATTNLFHLQLILINPRKRGQFHTLELINFQKIKLTLNWSFFVLYLLLIKCFSTDYHNFSWLLFSFKKIKVVIIIIPNAFGTQDEWLKNKTL